MDSCNISSYHVNSFNYLAEHGVRLAALDVPPEKFRLENGDAIEMRYLDAQLGCPSLDLTSGSYGLDVMKIYPAECRQRGLTYRGPLKVGIEIRTNGVRTDSCEVVIGEVPIMLRSVRCNLYGLTKEQLIAQGEEGTEKGGYFICKGSEKVIRLLVSNRRNFPIGIVRRSFRDKGDLFTQFGIMLRSVRESHHPSLMTMHYLENGSISVALQFRREIFYVPFMYILKALVPISDLLIHDYLVKGRSDDHFWEGCVTSMLAICQEDGILNQETALVALGNRFRVALSDRIAPWETDCEAGQFLLKACVAVHLDSNEEKFFLLAYMAQKLIALVRGECAPESPDNPQFQEAAVSGHIMLLIIRERLENILGVVRRKVEMEWKRKSMQATFTSRELLRALGNQRNGEITRGLEFFLATGNLTTRSGLTLQQNSGFSVIAERINQLRFISHFRAIHRGAFFTEMRTTDVRKLRPEAWGFICPVHTPDGAPCGLLNHVTASVEIVTHLSNIRPLLQYLGELGVIGHDDITSGDTIKLYKVLVDGRFVGYVNSEEVDTVEERLRLSKINANDHRVPYTTEIVLIKNSPDHTKVQMQYPGLYLFTDPGRMIRPVYNLIGRCLEFIGTFEQVYLSICIDPEEAEQEVTKHQELAPTCLFSFAGNLIPFPDHNQSPRNVYQCQMGKQTMGTPVHAWSKRADNKMYRLQFPQDPLVMLESYRKYEMSDYPLGTNACVAVISYTGYDMEDAMVINKSSFQRGFAHGTVIKVERINLCERNKSSNDLFFADTKNPCNSIGDDGLPIPGRLYQEGEPYYSVIDSETGNINTHKFKYTEPAYCGLVRIVEESPLKGKCHALVQWRIQRNPIIGDKFASRHGQKGINSFLWPAESMPFSESGMVPDIIFNPHGFPSRMTIGMMIESMAGKAAAMHGQIYDASPFVFSEKKPAIDYFAKLLTQAGYNYYGNETMYSGVDGRVMEVQIFFGIVYYQRLRHMVADKFQVRSTGPVDPVTLQPVKGRKKGGGIRFGEMERDAMIAHGASFALQDRLFNCSDRELAYVCARCKSLLSVSKAIPLARRKIKQNYEDLTDRQLCLKCGKSDEVYIMEVPRVFRFLAAELATINVHLQLTVKNPSEFKK